MAEKQSKTVRLTHVNGATAVVPEEKAERLVADGLFTRPDAEPESDHTGDDKSGKPAGK